MDAAVTVRLNAGREAVVTPSVTEMTIPEVVPTLAVAGVPLSWPVAVLKVAHVGLLTIENVRGLPVAVGIKV
jgi:hypothetical protein